MAFSRFNTDREERINYERLRNYRLNRTKEFMEKEGMGCLLTWEAWNVRYITGAYVTIPTRWMENQPVVLPVNGDPWCFAGGSGYPFGMRETMPWLKGRIGPGRLPRVKLARNKEEMQPYVDFVSKMMNEHGVADKPLGIDGTTKQMMVYEAFKDAGIEVVDATPMMFDIRAIKNFDEIELCRIACACADAAFADIADAIRPGVTECELVGIGMKRLYELGADETMEFVCCSGERTNPYRIDYTERQLRPRDLVYVDINGNSFQGYKSCYYRTFSCGRATSEQKEIFYECRDMMRAGLSAVKAGNTSLDICEKWPTDPHYWGPYDSWTQTGGLALGHGLGISLHEKPWINYGYSKDYPEVLEEGMVIALETWTGPYGGRDGVRLEENVVVTKDGYDLLTLWPIDEITECWI